jgi:hypothetical protein
MTPEQFAYWLNGFAELNPSMEQPSPEQWRSIAEHLKTVFVKVTPEFKINPSISFPPGARSRDIADAIGKACRVASGETYLGQPIQVIC